MASDNVLLRHRKQRYKVMDSNTKEVYAEGFTSQKKATQWARENLNKSVRWCLWGYEEKVNKI